MLIPELGELVQDPVHEWYVSEPVAVPVLGGRPCRFIVDGYEDDQAPQDFHAAIAAFLALDGSVLTDAAPHVFAYYRDIVDEFDDADGDVEIAGPQDVFDHVRLGDEPTVSRQGEHVYISLECECDWEPEHGLQIVFRDGQVVSKIGPYNGHLTNASAYADASLQNVVYHSHR